MRRIQKACQWWTGNVPKKRLNTALFRQGNGYVVRDPSEDHSELADLFRSGDLVKASELEAKCKAEAEAKRQFELAAEDRQRDNRYANPRPTTKDMTSILKPEKMSG